MTLSLLPPAWASFEDWLVRTFIILGIIIIGPWAGLVLYDLVLYILRLIFHTQATVAAIAEPTTVSDDRDHGTLNERNREQESGLPGFPGRGRTLGRSPDVVESSGGVLGGMLGGVRGGIAIHGEGGEQLVKRPTPVQRRKTTDG